MCSSTRSRICTTVREPVSSKSEICTLSLTIVQSCCMVSSNQSLSQSFSQVSHKVRTLTLPVRAFPTRYLGRMCFRSPLSLRSVKRTTSPPPTNPTQPPQHIPDSHCSLSFTTSRLPTVCGSPIPLLQYPCCTTERLFRCILSSC